MCFPMGLDYAQYYVLANAAYANKEKEKNWGVINDAAVRTLSERAEDISRLVDKSLASAGGLPEFKRYTQFYLDRNEIRVYDSTQTSLLWCFTHMLRNFLGWFSNVRYVDISKFKNAFQPVSEKGQSAFQQTRYVFDRFRR